MGGQISSSGSGENFNTTASISNSSRNSFNNNNNNCCIINSPSLSSIGSSGRKSRHWRTPPSSNSASPPINNNNNSSSSSFPFSSSTNSSFSSSSNGYNNTPFLIKQQLIRHTSLSTTNTGLKGRQKNNNSSHSNNNQWKVIPSPFIDNYNFNVGCSFIGPKEDTHCLLSQQSGMPGVYKNRHGSTYSKSSIGSTIKSINGGPSTFVSRWGGFTRALPGGFKGNNNKERHLMAKSLIKETTQSQRKRHLPSSKNRREKIEEKEDKNNIYVNLPNNNEENVYNEFANLSISNYSSNNIENVNGSLYQPSKDQREEEYDKDIVQYRRKKILENNNLNSKDFSLKSSLKRSGSRLFNGLIRGGYIRSLIGEDEYEEQVVRNGWEKGKEDENQQYNDNLQQTEFLDNNNNKTTNDLPKQQKLTISTSALRASLRQAKKKMMPKCSSVTTKPRINGNVEVYLNKKGDGELVSSMLLAMATCPPAETTSKRPFSAPTDNYTNTSIKTQKTKDLWFSADWSEENQKNKILDNLSPLKSNKRKVIQANSGELIKAIGYFICQHSCWPGIIEQFEPGHLGTWLTSVDRALILQGWQDVAFINPANLVFLFMLIRDAFLQGESKYLTSLEELHSFVLMCLYVSYSYMGNEISYPLKPFITENADRSLFWSKCIRLIKIHSNQMLRINASSTLFLEVFTELKTYCLPRQLNRNNDWLNNE